MRSPRTRKAIIARAETQLTKLIDELFWFGDDVSVDLATRLSDCQTERQARVRAYILTKTPFQGWGYRCRSAACWACRRSIVTKWRERARTHFHGADNDHCSLLTIAIARLGSLCPLTGVNVKFRRDLRNVRDAMARRCPTWNTVSFLGCMELDALEQTDVPLLGISRRTLIPRLPIAGGQPDAAVWLPHAHLCVHHPDVHRTELARAMREQWDGADRVDVRPFHAGRVAEDNAADCVGYALKFRSSTMFHDGTTADWPTNWVAQVWSWLHGMGRGLQPLRVQIGVRASATDRILASLVPEFAEVEPMPIAL